MVSRVSPRLLAKVRLKTDVSPSSARTITTSVKPISPMPRGWRFPGHNTASDGTTALRPWSKLRRRIFTRSLYLVLQSLSHLYAARPRMRSRCYGEAYDDRFVGHG